jgi:hypothetical protein
LKLLSYIKLIPLAGIVLFILLYIIAAIVYPGGNYLNNHSKGFSVLHNYWCDLLNENAQNGEINTSRPYAVSATIILCSSLIFFWYFIPKALNTKLLIKLLIQITGITSMFIGMFIFTSYHSEVITYAGLFGGIAFVLTFLGLYKAGWYKLIYFGVVCLVLGVITFAIYKTRMALIILPMIQKVTLLLSLAWIFLIDLKMRRLTEKHL